MTPLSWSSLVIHRTQSSSPFSLLIPRRTPSRPEFERAMDGAFHIAVSEADVSGADGFDLPFLCALCCGSGQLTF